MLFTDSDVISVGDLSQVDGEVLSVAAASKPPIVIDGPGSICEQTWRECSSLITSSQQMYTNILAAADVGGAHQGAVNYTGTASNRSRTRLNQVVASESQYGGSASGVQLWMAYAALALFFRDASSRMVKSGDRYEGKYDRYDKQADYWWRQLRQNGLPFLSQPLEAPGAKHGINAGTWGAGNLSAVVGSGVGGQFAVAVTYYDGSRYQSQAVKGNAESGPSVVLNLAVGASHVLKVDIGSLNPSTGVQDAVGFSQPAWTPLKASHWNLWVGVAGGSMYLQASTPIGTKVVTLAGDPITSGIPIGNGQYPDLMLSFARLAGRG